MIDRSLEKILLSKLFEKKAILLMGPRQVGKTTLLRQLFPNQSDVVWLNGDEIDVQNLFASISADRFKAIVGQKKIVIIDEAQRIENIGLRLKLITDSIPDVQLIATGSSSFELANKVNEPLTGRKWEYKMFPLSFSEMVQHHGLLEEKRLLPHRLLYGYYPDVVNNQGSEREILKQLSDSYLYKDVLLLEQIKKPEKLIKLLQALALQVGSQVSYNELGNLCGLDTKTVEKYIAVLEQTFVVFKLSSFARNARNELKNSKKIYFYDNGIRNALLSNFNQIENRTDIGALWENFLISERIKYINYNSKWANFWFWRTKEQKELDFIEEEDGKISTYEFKWNSKSKIVFPKQFSGSYPNSSFELIHQDNLEKFLL
ncbi:ATP-binding protein [Flavobacterium sp. J49]|uniref:ATP-binding protein n=1 Tax=Flavobacterium sp. J49 TaxID=2718534 RepID=UPI001592D658|nr:ATP-binding protein [Flavobacterium sp. J49]MBF6640006.1 ATP-binding protein [Flavobacterium sp. J49]NIC01251.1 ATP-binding protein [Flavobacterium sp. J49]